jgi:hypothetical protein
VPGRDKRDGGDNAGIEKNADQDGHPDGFEKPRVRNSGVDSSAALPTDSNPVMKYGTI